MFDKKIRALELKVTQLELRIINYEGAHAITIRNQQRTIDEINKNREAVVAKLHDERILKEDKHRAWQVEFYEAEAKAREGANERSLNHNEDHAKQVNSYLKSMNKLIESLLEQRK